MSSQSVSTDRALYTIREVAELLGVTDRHIRRLREAGHLDAVDLSVRSQSRPLIRITRLSVERFIASRSIDLPTESRGQSKLKVPCYL